MIERLGRSWPSYTPYGRREMNSLALAPTSPHRDTSSTRAKQPFIHSRGAPQSSYICMPNAKRKLTFLSDWGDHYLPTHRTIWWRGDELLTCHFVLRLIRTPLRLKQSRHADPLLLSASFVVYICVPNANGSSLSDWGEHGLATHESTVEKRPPDLPLLLITIASRIYQRSHDCHLLQKASTVVCDASNSLEHWSYPPMSYRRPNATVDRGFSFAVLWP